MFGTDSMAVLIISLAVLVGWVTGALAVYLLVIGGTRGTHPSPHRDGEERSEGGRGVPVHLHPEA
jgi:hypothetical protein